MEPNADEPTIDRRKPATQVAVKFGIGFIVPWLALFVLVLPGYADYCAKLRWRLMPGIW